MTEQIIVNAIKRAYQLGQTYRQQADSDSERQWAKAYVTAATFRTLVEETIANLAASDTEQAGKRRPIASIKQEAETGLVIGDEIGMRDALQAILSQCDEQLGITTAQGVTEQAGKPLTDKALQVARLHFGYAPGYYMNQCGCCRKSMDLVDKRCRVCIECADKAIAAHGITGEEV